MGGFNTLGILNFLKIRGYEKIYLVRKLFITEGQEENEKDVTIY